MSKQRFLGGLLGANPLRPATAEVTTTPPVSMYSFPSGVVENGEVVDLTTTEDANGFCGWNSDGTAFWTVGNGTADILEWPCATAYDPSTAGTPTQHYDGYTSLGKPSGTRMGGCWNHDGTRFTYLENDGWFEIVPAGDPYTMNSATDTITSDFNHSSVTSGSSSRTCCFNDDGTRFYVAYDNSDTVYCYETTTTGSSTGGLTYNSIQTTSSNLGYALGSMAYSPTSNGIYVLCQTTPMKLDFLPTTATGNFNGSANSTFTTSISEYPRGVGLFQNDAKLHVMDQNYKMYEIELGSGGGSVTTPGDPFTDIVGVTDPTVDTSVAFTETTNLYNPAGQLRDFLFNGDGTKVYLIYFDTGTYSQQIREASLSTAYDLTTAGSSSNINWSYGYNSSQNWFWSHDGTRVHALKLAANQYLDFFYHECSTPYDLTTAGTEQSGGMAAPTGYSGSFSSWGAPIFNADGTKCFWFNQSGVSGHDEYMYEWNLSTAYDLTTSTYVTKYNCSSVLDNAKFVYAADSTGTKFIGYPQGNTNIKTFTTTNPYDFSSVTAERTNDSKTHHISTGGQYVPDIGTFFYSTHEVYHAGTEYWVSKIEYDLTPGSVISTDRTTANVGILSLDEAGPEDGPSSGSTVGTWWTWETPLNSQWSRDGDYESSRTGSYGGQGICVDTEVTSGKYYAEFWWDILKNGTDGKDKAVGIATNNSNGMADYLGSVTTAGWGHYAANGSQYPPSGGAAWGSAISNGDVVGLAVDYDNGKVWTHVNGTWSSVGGDPSSGGSGHTWTTALTAHPSTPARIALTANGTSGSVQLNGGDNGTFGGNVTAGGNTDTNGLGDFKYTVPTGFQGLYDAVAGSAPQLTQLNWGGIRGRDVVTGGAASGDPHWSNVTLLLDGDNNLTDRSGNTSMSWTGSANYSSSGKHSSALSIVENGTHVKSTANGSATNSFQFGTDPFTIETWIYLNSAVTGDAHIFCTRAIYSETDSYTWVLQNSGGNAAMKMYSNGFWYSASSTFAPQTWTHLAVTRDTSKHFHFFINGQLIDTVTNQTGRIMGHSANVPVKIGNKEGTSPADGIDGLLDDFRVTKGVARDIAADWAAGVYSSALPQGAAVAASTSLANTGILSLSELLQASYGVEVAAGGGGGGTSGTPSWWEFSATDAGANWQKDAAYQASRTGGGWTTQFLDTRFSTGKYYAEFRAQSTINTFFVGVGTTSAAGGFLGQNGTTGWGAYSNALQHYPNQGSWTPGFAYNASDVIGIAVDADTGTVWTHVNGTWMTQSGDPSSGGSGWSFNSDMTDFSSSGNPITIATSVSASSYITHFNGGDNGTFGGLETAGGYADGNGHGDFKYPVPTGFQGCYTLV